MGFYHCIHGTVIQPLLKRGKKFLISLFTEMEKVMNQESFLPMVTAFHMTMYAGITGQIKETGMWVYALL